MEGLIGSSVGRGGARSCWAHRRSCTGYQRLPAPAAAADRGVRIGRRTAALGSAARRLGRLRRRASARWPSPLRLVHRIIDAYISSMLSRPLQVGTSSSSAAAAAPVVPPPSSPPKPRRRDANCGRGVVLNIFVGEVLLRRSTSEVRRSPLQPQPRKAARCASVRA